MTARTTFFKVAGMILPTVSLLVAGCTKFDDSAIWDKLNELDDRLTIVEAAVDKANTDLNSLSAIVNVLNNQLSITGVVPIEGGFYIAFSDGSNYKITSGSSSGSSAPVIGIAESGGIYYWTLTVDGNTTWLTDDSGNKVPVSGKDGKDGKDGTNGKDGKDGKDGTNGKDGKDGTDGVTPKLSVQSGYWVISYDGGATYTYILDGNGSPIKAGCDCTQFFRSVTYGNGILTFVLMDGTVIPVEAYRDERLDDVVPEEIQAHIVEYMPLYTGVDPPKLDLSYLIHPYETVYCEDYETNQGGFAPGRIISDYKVRFSNFDMKDNTVDLEEASVSGTDYNIGEGAFVSGSGNYFTAFFNTVGASGGISTKTAVVISGIAIEGGIKNFNYAFVMVEKGDDPEGKLMKEGVYRIFKDGDGYSELTDWDEVSATLPSGLVDLGLPSGLLWAECNLGASSSEEYGNYYAWGETSPKSSYSWSNYKWCNGSETSLTKYNTLSANGTVDNKTVLDPEDDAATVALGDGWYTPTYADFSELCNTSNCTWSFTTQKGVSGCLFTSVNNGNTLFLPLAGGYQATTLFTGFGYYWTSVMSSSQPQYAAFLDMEDSEVDLGYVIPRYLGLSIRPVYLP